MKVIFLDIDGVLNAEADFVHPNGATKKHAPRLHTTDGETYNGISQPRVRRLARICEETGAKIVLISSWKAGYEDYIHGRPDNHIGRYLANALSRKGLHVIDSTFRHEHNWACRAPAILKWIEEWDKKNPDDPVRGLAILDDEDFQYVSYGLGDFWVKTTYDGKDGGLNDKEADLAITIIKRGETPFIG